jgi:hypothetical protein
MRKASEGSPVSASPSRGVGPVPDSTMNLRPSMIFRDRAEAPLKSDVVVEQHRGGEERQAGFPCGGRHAAGGLALLNHLGDRKSGAIIDTREGSEDSR